MKKLTIYILLFSFVIILQNCQKDDFDSNNLPNTETPASDALFKSENFGESTLGNFVGLITNISGTKLADVEVTIGSITTMTDHNGIFVINNADVFENFAYIKAKKEDYINGSRVVIPKENGVNYIRIVMLKKEVTATISSGEPSQVSLSNGTQVSFSGNFVTSNGDTYNGQVEVVLHYLPPNNQDTFNEMPGSLFAQSSTNDARSLESFGMVSVNLFSPSGDELNIDKNYPATIEVPVDISQISTAPEIMNLWYFDEEQGYWKEEGQASLNGNKYVGQVSHFTWWNCDLPIDFVTLCFSISPNDSSASTNYYVEIESDVSNQLIFSGIVYSDNSLECGLIPENENIIISVYGSSETCAGELVHQQTSNGYATDTTINISFTDPPSTITTSVSGTATNCLGNPITNGYLIVDSNTVISITDGIINFGIQHCIASIQNVSIFDLDSNQWSGEISVNLNGGEVNIGNINTCENTGGVFIGLAFLYTQQEVNTFGLFGYTEIEGQIYIGDSDGVVLSDITDLSPLSSIESISSSLIIKNNDMLTNLEGLNNINSIGHGVFIEENASLTSIDALSNLASTYGVYIFYNESLQTIEFTSLTDCLTVQIAYNHDLSAIKFNNLSSIQNDLNISYNESLINLGEFNSLNSTGILTLESNSSLLSINGLSNLTTSKLPRIENNPALTSLEGLENLISIIPASGSGSQTITLNNNIELTDFCSLQNLLINGDCNLEEVFIFNNAYNPTVQNIIDGDCSQ